MVLVNCCRKYFFGSWRKAWQAGRQAAAMESLLGRLASLHQLLRIEHNFTVPHVTVSTVWYHAHKVLCAHNRILAVTMLQTMLQLSARISASIQNVEDDFSKKGSQVADEARGCIPVISYIQPLIGLIASSVHVLSFCLAPFRRIAFTKTGTQFGAITVSTVRQALPASPPPLLQALIGKEGGGYFII